MDAEQPEGKGEMEFGLEVQRFAINQVGVQLSLRLHLPQVEVDTAYRVVFEIEPHGPDDTDLDGDLRTIAAQVAPATLYPFIRETVMTTAVKAALPPFLPPIVNFRHVFDPNRMELPPPPRDGDEETEAGE